MWRNLSPLECVERRVRHRPLSSNNGEQTEYVKYLVKFFSGCGIVGLINTSVTRFGEISPLWQNFKNILQLYDGLISIWQTFEPTLENSVFFGPIYVVVNGQILSKHSGHTDQHS